MGYIQERVIRLRAQLTRVQTTLGKLYDSMSEMAATGAQSYAFDSGEGSHRVTRRSLSDIQNMIDRLQATESHLINELSGMGLVNIRLRRKRPSC